MIPEPAMAHRVPRSPVKIKTAPPVLFACGLAAMLAACQCTQRDAAPPAAANRAWAQVPKILKRIVPPKFPARDFVVTQYGAVGDGAADCTSAFRAAIDACTQAGGGRVVVPEGTFLTGAIHLRNNVNLHVSQGATLRFSTDPARYLPAVFTRFEGTEVMNFSGLIYAFEQTNIAVTGAGTLDGQAGDANWHGWTSTAAADIKRLAQMGKDNVPVPDRVFGQGHYLRPNFVQPVRCRNVLIEGVRLIHSPMWVLNPVYCTNVTIRAVTVQTKGPNTDGCDPDSCTDVLIKDCQFSNGDDCIAIKSGRDHDGRRVNLPSENLIIQNCVFEAGHGGVTMGSETAGGIRNVFAEGCRFDSADLEMAMRFKTNPARGGYIEDICLRRCTVKTAKFGIHMTMRYASSGAMAGEAVPRVRNIDIRDSKFANLTRQPIFIEGWSPAIPITDVTIANCELESAGKKAANTITNAARIRLINVKVNGEVVE
jgi:polygalacturonase